MRNTGITNLRVCIVLLLVGLLLAACGSIGTKNRLIGFSDAIRDYTKQLRWEEFEAAAGYHRKPDGTPIESDFSKVLGSRITSIEVLSQSLDEAAENGEAVVKIDYVTATDAVLKTVRHRQIWWRSADADAWFMNNGFPDLSK